MHKLVPLRCCSGQDFKGLIPQGTQTPSIAPIGVTPNLRGVLTCPLRTQESIFHGGRTTWTNVVAACSPCNLKKANKLPAQCGMQPLATPVAPNIWQLQENGRGFPPNYLHESWRDYLYWDSELQQT